MTRRLRPLGVVPFAVLIVVWELAVVTGWAPETHIPRPWTVVATFVEQMTVPFAGAASESSTFSFCARALDIGPQNASAASSLRMVALP